MTPTRYEQVCQTFHDARRLSSEQRSSFLAAAAAGDPELAREVEQLLAEDDDGASFLASPIAGTGIAVGLPQTRNDGRWIGVPSNPLPPGSSSGVAPHGTEDASTSFSQAAALTWARIGAYRILRSIGEGGMGTVYEAEQTHPLRRRVALKLVRAGMNTREVVARFDMERQALALMNHPSVAAIYDAGVTPDGRPFFVMEYVPGESIVRYCEAGALSIRRRLELFRSLCDGVQHAHQKGIVHRDLKPSNVRVSDRDGVAIPKVIDFGIAKAVGQAHAPDTAYTRHGQLLGTIEYMSPEQATAPQSVDTRSDIYSLGALLYELLTGRPPLQRTGGIGEMLERLTHADPPHPRTLRRDLNGDLETIVLRCLAKDPARRYPSVGELHRDIGHYLAGEPIDARRESSLYVFRKLVQRHRSVAAALVLAGCTVLIGTIVATSQAIRATRAEGEARETARRATELAEVATRTSTYISNILDNLAGATTTSGSSGREPADRRQLIRAAARDAEQCFSSEPRVLAGILAQLATTARALGASNDSLEWSQAALAAAAKSADAYPGEYLARLAEMAIAYSHASNVTQARAWIDMTLEFIERERLRVRPGAQAYAESALSNAHILLGDYAGAKSRALAALDCLHSAEADPTELVEVLSQLRAVCWNLRERDAAVYYAERAVELSERAFGLESETTVRCVLARSVSQVDAGRAAEPDFFEVLRRAEATGNGCLVAEAEYRLGTSLLSSDPRVAEKYACSAVESGCREWTPGARCFSERLLAMALVQQARLDEAEALLRSLIESGSECAIGVDLGFDHSHSVALANLLWMQGRYEEAAGLYETLLADTERTFGKFHPHTSSALLLLARAYADAGARERLEWLRQACDEFYEHSATLPESDPHRSGALLLRGRIEQALGHCEAAEPLLRDCLALRTRHLAADDHLIAYAANSLGDVLIELARYDEAESLLGPSDEKLWRRIFGTFGPIPIESTRRLIRLYEASGRTESAEPFRARLRRLGLPEAK